MARHLGIAGIAWTASTLAACAGGPVSSSNASRGDTADTAVLPGLPVIDHTPPDSPHSASQPLVIEAHIADDSGVLVASVDMRHQTEVDFVSRGLQFRGGDLWETTIDPGDLYTAAIHYYLEAVDYDGNDVTLPERAPDDYFEIDLVE